MILQIRLVYDLYGIKVSVIEMDEWRQRKNKMKNEDIPSKVDVVSFDSKKGESC